MCVCTYLRHSSISLLRSSPILGCVCTRVYMCECMHVPTSFARLSLVSHPQLLVCVCVCVCTYLFRSSISVLRSSPILSLVRVCTCVNVCVHLPSPLVYFSVKVVSHPQLFARQVSYGLVHLVHLSQSIAVTIATGAVSMATSTTTRPTFVLVITARSLENKRRIHVQLYMTFSLITFYNA